MSDVFISYSRADTDFVRRLFEALEDRGKDAWVDWEDIPPSAEWMAEIEGAIEGGGAFLFVLTPSSAASEVCARELEHAVANGKRIIPITIGQIDPQIADPELAKRNWVIFASNGADFDASVETLLTAIDTDLEWAAAHTQLLAQAHRWEDHGRERSRLLRGEDLRNAEASLAGAAADADPAPSPLQREYVLASRRAASARARATIAAVATALVVAIGLAILALVQRNEANDQKQLAQARALVSGSQAVAESDPLLSARLAREAVSTSPSPDATAQLRVAVGGLGHVALMSGHDESARSVAFDPDGERVISAGGDGTARVWDAASGDQLIKLESADGDAGSVFDAEISPDGKIAATAGPGTVARIWSLDSGEEELTLGDGDEQIFAARFDRDGGRLATVDRSAARVWDLESGEPLVSTRFGGNAIGFDASGRLLAVASSGPASIRIVDASSGAVLTELPLTLAINEGLSSVAFSPDGGRLIAAAADGIARIWNLRTNRVELRLRHRGGTLSQASFSPDGRLALTAGSDGSARIWDAADGARIRVLTGHSAGLNDAAFDPSGRLIATASQDRTVRVWEVDPQAEVVETVDDARGAIAFDPTADRFAVPAGDGSTAIREIDRAEPTATLPAPPGDVVAIVDSLAFSSDGSRLATGSDDDRARIWDADGGQALSELGGHEDDVTSVAWSANDDLLATSSFDGTARIWDPGDGSERRALGEPTAAGVNAVALSPDGNLAATAGFESQLRLWDPRSGEAKTTIDTAIGSLYSLDFSSDSKRLAVGGSDGFAAIFDTSSGEQLATLSGHSTAVSEVGFSPDDALLLTGSADGTTRIWEARSGSQLALFESREVEVLSAQFDRSGQLIGSVAADGRARIRRCGPLCASTDELIERADRLAGTLTEGERNQYVGG